MRAPGLLLAALTTLGSCKPAPPGDDSTTTTSETTTTTTNPGASTTRGPDPTSLTPTSTTTTTTTTDSFTIGPDLPSSAIECNGLLQFDPECPPGQKCTVDGSYTASHCVDIVDDPRGLYEPCTMMGDALSGHDDCDLGMLCWNLDDQGHGRCIGLADCPNGGAICTCADPNASASLCQDCTFGYCFPPCDPLLPDCPDAEVCIPIPSSSVGSFGCFIDASGDAGQTNDPCEFTNACDPGLTCIDIATASSACMPGSTGCCQPFCKFPNTPCPNPDQKCLQWFDPMQAIPPGMEDVGICAIPS